MVVACQFKVWVKSSAEQQFLYGNHVMKSGLGRITENTQQYQGVIVYSMNDVPLVRHVMCHFVCLLWHCTKIVVIALNEYGDGAGNTVEENS